MTTWPFPDDGFSDNQDRRRRPTDNPDIRLTYDVTERLHEDPRVGSQPITVEVQHRVVLLAGTVASEEVRRAAGMTVRSVDGVRDVCNALDVATSGHRGTSTSRPGRQPQHTSEVVKTPGDGDLRRFDEIAASLTAETPSLRRLPDRWPGRVSRTVLIVLGAVTWALMSVLMVALGWIGVLITCAVSAILIERVASSQARRRRASAAPKRGT